MQGEDTWGLKKMEARLTDQFYWSRLKAKVKKSCASCPTCQLTASLSDYRNPFVELLIIEALFERITMDLVGLLVKSARGHHYILVSLDMKLGIQKWSL